MSVHGIDLGTSFSGLAAADAAGVRLVPARGANGSLLTPSVVCLDAQGHAVVGEAAWAALECADPPESVRRFELFKRNVRCGGYSDEDTDLLALTERYTYPTADIRHRHMLSFGNLVVEEVAQRHVKSDTGNLHAEDPIWELGIGNWELLICWGSSRFSGWEKTALLLVMRAKAFSYLSFPAYTQFCG